MGLIAKDYEKYLNQLEKMPDFSASINKYRKTSYKLTVKNTSDKPVSASISVKQKKSDFDFGCNALMLGGFESEEQNRLYEKQLVSLFNLITTTLCFSVYSDEQGNVDFNKSDFRRPSPYTVAEFAHANGLKLKGQPLLADSWLPERLKGKSSDETWEQYKNWFYKVESELGNLFDIFDVVNEAFLSKDRTPDFPLYDDSLLFADKAMQMAEGIFKNNVLEINEASNVNFISGERYFELCKRIINKKIRLDSIGFQFHMPYCNLENLNPTDIYNNYLHFCTLNRPLYISEITIPSKFDDCSKQTSEQLQAKITEALYRLWFSIPKMNGIIFWNLKDGASWMSEGDWLGCLVDSDFNEKPSYKAVDKLINHEWKTSFTEKISLNAHENTDITFDGFCGEYEVTCSDENIQCTMQN